MLLGTKKHTKQNFTGKKTSATFFIVKSSLQQAKEEATNSFHDGLVCRLFSMNKQLLFFRFNLFFRSFFFKIQQPVLLKQVVPLNYFFHIGSINPVAIVIGQYCCEICF